MKKVLLSVTVAVGLSGAAMAGGDLAPVPVAPADSWSGFYVGAQAGYIWGDADVDTSNQVKPNHFSLHPDGGMGGFFAGYNWKMSNDWLFGLEIGGNWMSNEDDPMIAVTVVGGSTPVDYHIKQDWEASVVGRVGKVADDTYLPYILAGISWTQLKAKYSGDGTLIPSSWEQWESDTVAGFTVGVGLEYKISQNFHTRIEYRHNNYQKAHFRHADLESSTDYNSDVVTAGFVYKF